MCSEYDVEDILPDDRRWVCQSCSSEGGHFLDCKNKNAPQITLKQWLSEYRERMRNGG